jgi:hypothetical protein
MDREALWLLSLFQICLITCTAASPAAPFGPFTDPDATSYKFETFTSVYVSSTGCSMPKQQVQSTPTNCSGLDLLWLQSPDACSAMPGLETDVFGALSRVPVCWGLHLLLGVQELKAITEWNCLMWCHAHAP